MCTLSPHELLLLLLPLPRVACPKLEAAAQAPHIACVGPLRWIFLNRYRNDLRLLPNEFAYTNTGGQTDGQTNGETETVGQIGSFPFTQLLLLFLFWAPSLHQVGGNLWLSISDMMWQNVAASSTRLPPSLRLSLSLSFSLLPSSSLVDWHFN